MRILIEFECPAGHLAERLVDARTQAITCGACACENNECGVLMHRRLAAPRVRLEGITGSFPGAYYAWERKREQKMAVEQRNLREHGTYT